MAVDELRTELEREQAPWDDLRERRVLARVLKTHDAVRERRVVKRRAMFSAAVGAAAAVLVVVLWSVIGGWRSSEGEVVAVATGSAPVAEPEPVSAPVMRLPDGSRAMLANGALIHVDVAQAESLVIVQEPGRVHYDVVRDERRVFEVLAGDVRVRVLGTAFWVDRGEREVRVEVERGRVEVKGPSKTALLTAGDSVVFTSESAEPSERTERKVDAGSEARALVSAPAPSGMPPEPTSAGDLMREADAARKAGESARATALLERVVREHPGDPRATSAWFTLARIYRSQGQTSRAAEAFGRVAGRGGPLAEDAMAEEAMAWSASGDGARAKATAERYLLRYPNGAYVKGMRRLAGKD